VQAIPEIFKQLSCFILDWTSSHLVTYYAIRRNPGWAGG
jgi:hypothetical protein